MAYRVPQWPSGFVSGLEESSMTNRNPQWPRGINPNWQGGILNGLQDSSMAERMMFLKKIAPGGGVCSSQPWGIETTQNAQPVCCVKRMACMSP